MPVVLAPALDLGALTGVLLLIGLLSVVSYTFVRLADVLNFSVLGIHPLRGVATAIESTIVAGCNTGIEALQNVAKALWNGLTWSWGEFLDGINAFTGKTEAAFSLLWGTSIPKYVRAAVRPIVSDINAASAKIEALTRNVANDVARLDAKVESTARATIATVERDTDKAVAAATHSIDADIRAIKSSVDQAIDHALSLARSESQAALGALRSAEDSAIGAVSAAENATAREIQDLMRSVGQSDIAGIAATVALLSTLVQTIAQETGLENAECRGKVKNICATDPLDWTNLLAGAAMLGVGFGLAEIIEAGREVIQYVEAGAADFA